MSLIGKKSKESIIQSTYISWLKYVYPKVYLVTASFPNGGARDLKYGARLKREGLRKGFPDLGIFWPCGEYHGAFIEFKSPKGVLRKEQKDILEILSDKKYFCKIARSVDEAIDFTKKYINCEI